MPKRKLNVLITGTGGPTPRSFARALRMGHYGDYRLFGTDIHPYAIGLYQQDIFEESFITPMAGENGYWFRMLGIIKSCAIDIAIIQPEKEVIAWSKYLDKNPEPCKVLVPPSSVVEIMCDKITVSNLLEGDGLTPKSLAVNKSHDHLEHVLSEKLSYPVWVRSSSGSSGLGSFKAESISEVEDWIHMNEQISSFMISPFLPGRNLACKLLFFNGELIRSAMAERISYIMAKVSPSGITGNTSMGRLINHDEALSKSRKGVEKVFRQCGQNAHGFFTVDLKGDAEGVPYITEINVRHVAFTSAFAQGGANLCEDTVRLLDGDPSFAYSYHNYSFDNPLVFLREVDAVPILLREEDIL